METSCRVKFVSAAGEATEETKNEEQMCKYRELLRGIQEKEKKLQEDRDVEMEITWVPGTHTCLSAPNPSLGLEIDSFDLPSGLKETTEQLVKKKLEEQNQLTPWEEFLQKKKEKKKLKKSQRKQVRRATMISHTLAFSYITSEFPPQGQEEMSDDDVPADVDLRDSFFAEELAKTCERNSTKTCQKPIT